MLRRRARARFLLALSAPQQPACSKACRPRVFSVSPHWPPDHFLALAPLLEHATRARPEAGTVRQRAPACRSLSCRWS